MQMRESRDTEPRPNGLPPECGPEIDAIEQATDLPMGAGDIGEVVEIERASFVDPWSRASFVAELSADCGSWCRVLRLGGRLAGYMIVWFVDEEAHLANIAVAPWARNRGLAQQMLDHLYEEAYLRGSRTIVLEVRASNRGAVRLYERNGFVPGGIRKDYYRKPREDALVMVRFLRLQEARP
jgi:ribosomal-protein-alanine N-acetyltransferase